MHASLASIHLHRLWGRSARCTPRDEHAHHLIEHMRTLCWMHTLQGDLMRAHVFLRRSGASDRGPRSDRLPGGICARDTTDTFFSEFGHNWQRPYVRRPYALLADSIYIHSSRIPCAKSVEIICAIGRDHLVAKATHAIRRERTREAQRPRHEHTSAHVLVASTYRHMHSS